VGSAHEGAIDAVSNEKRTVIDSVRLALGREPGAPVQARPPILPPRAADTLDHEVDRLLKEVSALSGTAARLNSGDVGASLQRLVEQEGVRRATCWSTPRLSELDVEGHLRACGVEIVAPQADKHALAQCDLGVTEAAFALPETGTLGLLSSPEKPRGVSLLPRVHLAMVARSAFRADLHQLFADAKVHPYLILISGPSRTADIELTVTLGVHGPRAVHVWVLDDRD
jgi:L-lactate dehydrogenase complex protein LldG